MGAARIITFWYKKLVDIRSNIKFRFLIVWIIPSMVITSCQSDPHASNWYDETLTICQYLELNKEEYSKSYRLLDESKMLNTLCGYNPYGDGYTLFLPTDEAMDNFVLQNQNYENFEEMLLDTSFIYALARYHIIKRRVHTDEFPDGAFMDSTLTGERLTSAFYTNGDNQLIKVNKIAPIIKSNLKMTNGFIHVISGVMQQLEISGYDLLQQQDDYSILAQAMALSGIKKNLWWAKYTILAEHDSIYNRKGIFNVQDLIDRVAIPGRKLTDKSNTFYKFVGYHFLGGELYLNDFPWGNKKYATMASTPLVINVGVEIKINPGVEVFGIEISESADTTVIDYIRPIWEDCNIMSGTGPIHSISDILFFEPFPE